MATAAVSIAPIDGTSHPLPRSPRTSSNEYSQVIKSEHALILRRRATDASISTADRKIRFRAQKNRRFGGGRGGKATAVSILVLRNAISDLDYAFRDILVCLNILLFNSVFNTARGRRRFFEAYVALVR